MAYILRCAHLFVLYGLLPLVVIAAYVHWYVVRKNRFRYPLTTELKSSQIIRTHPYKKILMMMRFVLLCLLAFLISKPQWVDSRTQVTVEGIDIMLVLDISGSMNHPHHEDDRRSRINVAKEEAIRFVQKRDNDAIGLVLFAQESVSRCPLTADKKILQEIIAQTEIGALDEKGTMLAKGIITAANRLRSSKAKSKIMIVLTDGEPSEGDDPIDLALDIAKKMGIKIYTIGITGDIVVFHPFYGLIKHQSEVNTVLLTKIAQDTGGAYFEAKKPDDMRRIYDTINTLEKTQIEAPVFSVYYDWFMPFLQSAWIIFVAEIIVSSLIWFGL